MENNALSQVKIRVLLYDQNILMMLHSETEKREYGISFNVLVSHIVTIF